MPMVQVGMGLSCVVLLVGAGFTGSVVLRNGGRLSDFLSEIQPRACARRFCARKGRAGMGRDGGNNVGETLLMQLYRWAMVTCGGNLMHVTKQNMANGVSSMTKHLEQAQSSLAKVVRDNELLTQRIQHVDDKLDRQREISGQIRDEITGARLKFKNIGSEMEKIKQVACGLGKLDSIEAKQNMSLASVMSLVQFIKQKGGRLPDRLEGPQRTVRRFGARGTKTVAGAGAAGAGNRISESWHSRAASHQSTQQADFALIENQRDAFTHALKKFV